MSNQSYIYNPKEDRIAATGAGFQIPRLSTTQRLATVVGPGDAGMLVFDTTLSSLFLWTGTVWSFAGGIGGGILNGIGSPNGVVTATGPAIYLDNTDPTAPVLYLKSTSGTSDNQWV
jgi:hypothetical protein